MDWWLNLGLLFPYEAGKSQHLGITFCWMGHILFPQWQAVISHCRMWFDRNNPGQPSRNQCPGVHTRASAVITARLWHAKRKRRAETSWNKPTLAQREAITRRSRYTVLVRSSSGIVLKSVTRSLTPCSVETSGEETSAAVTWQVYLMAGQLKNLIKILHA